MTGRVKYVLGGEGGPGRMAPTPRKWGKKLHVDLHASANRTLGIRTHLARPEAQGGVEVTFYSVQPFR